VRFSGRRIKDVVISYLESASAAARGELAWKRAMIPSVGNQTANKIYESLACAPKSFALVRRDFKYQPRGKQGYEN